MSKYYYEYDEVEKCWSVWETFPGEENQYDVHHFDCVDKIDAQTAVELLECVRVQF